MEGEPLDQFYKKAVDIKELAHIGLSSERKLSFIFVCMCVRDIME